MQRTARVFPQPGAWVLACWLFRKTAVRVRHRQALAGVNRPLMTTNRTGENGDRRHCDDGRVVVDDDNAAANTGAGNSSDGQGHLKNDGRLSADGDSRLAHGASLGSMVVGRQFWAAATALAAAAGRTTLQLRLTGTAEMRAHMHPLSRGVDTITLSYSELSLI
jgi:hypothetical protein